MSKEYYMQKYYTDKILKLEQKLAIAVEALESLEDLCRGYADQDFMRNTAHQALAKINDNN